MSGDGERTEQTPVVTSNNVDHAHNKGPAPKAPSQKTKNIPNGQIHVERDPRMLNQHLMPSFNEVVGEPGPGIYSFNSVWNFSTEIFTFTKLWCYRLLSLIFAIPCAIFWAIIVAIFSFLNIWCFIPFAKVIRIPMFAIEQVLRTTMDTFVAPTAHALGRLFTHCIKPELTTDCAKKQQNCVEVHLA